jgi:hypothetical protein
MISLCLFENEGQPSNTPDLLRRRVISALGSGESSGFGTLSTHGIGIVHIFGTGND